MCNARVQAQSIFPPPTPFPSGAAPLTRSPRLRASLPLLRHRRRYELELSTRRQLDRQLRDLKGNVRVFCRVRPLLAGTVPSGVAAVAALALGAHGRAATGASGGDGVGWVGAAGGHGDDTASRWARGSAALLGGASSVTFPDSRTVMVSGKGVGGSHRSGANGAGGGEAGGCAGFGGMAASALAAQPAAASSACFEFDAVFGPASSQAQLYESEIRELVPAVLDGFDLCLFAYGPTGSGKVRPARAGGRGIAHGAGAAPVAARGCGGLLRRPARVRWPGEEAGSAAC